MGGKVAALPWREYAGAVTLDPASTPKRFDILFHQRHHKGQASPGIYELSGTTWRMRLGFAGKDVLQCMALARNLMLQIPMVILNGHIDSVCRYLYHRSMLGS